MTELTPSQRMQELDYEVYKILAVAEATGSLGASVTGNKILFIAKSFYKTATKEEREWIINKIERLKKEPGVPFPLNYKDLLNS